MCERRTARELAPPLLSSNSKHTGGGNEEKASFKSEAVQESASGTLIYPALSSMCQRRIYQVVG